MKELFLAIVALFCVLAASAATAQPVVFTVEVHRSVVKEAFLDYQERHEAFSCFLLSDDFEPPAECDIPIEKEGGEDTEKFLCIHLSQSYQPPADFLEKGEPEKPKDSAPAPYAEPVREDVAVLPRDFLAELEKQLRTESKLPVVGVAKAPAPANNKPAKNRPAMVYGLPKR